METSINQARFDPDVLEILVNWIREREKVRIRKEAGEPWPWTDDPLLREWRFCNVRRSDDRISRELIARWYDQDAAPATLLVAASLGRLVNWTDALLDASGGAPFRMDFLDAVRHGLHARAARGEKVFTGAYVVPGVPGRNKVDSICDLVHRIAQRADEVLGLTLRATWFELTTFDGLGSFLAGQIAADLALLPVGRNWPDAFVWAPVGPGSARGWNRLTGQPLGRAVSQAEFDAALPQVTAILKARLPELWSTRPPSGQDVQSCLCELDKNLRLLRREGTVRARYHPPQAQASLI